MANHLHEKNKKQTNKKTIKCWPGQKSDSSRRITLYRTYPIYDAPLFAPCKDIQDSVGFWIPRCRFRIPGTGFLTLSVEFGFQIPIVNGIRDPSSRIPDSKASDFGTSRKSFPDSGFLKQWFLGLGNLDFLTWSDTFETVCMCEQRPYPVWFPGRRKSYPIRCEHIALYIKRKSKTVWGFWIPHRGFRIPSTGLWILYQWNLNSGFQSLVGFRIPWVVFGIPKPRIPKNWNPKRRHLTFSSRT